jgi:hypothetical protein
MASVSADVRCNRLKGYSRKCTAGYTGHTNNKHRNTECDYIHFYILEFFLILDIFLTSKPSALLGIKIRNYTRPDFFRYIRVRFNEGLMQSCTCLCNSDEMYITREIQ